MSWPVPLTVQSKEYICGRLFAGIAGSNPFGTLDVCDVSILLVRPAYEILYVAVLCHVHSITMTETVLTITDLPTYWWASTWS
jgi:hypothetical protein